MHAYLCREAVCTIFMMVFGMTRPRGELTTYRARGGQATDWANPTRSNQIFIPCFKSIINLTIFIEVSYTNFNSKMLLIFNYTILHNTIKSQLITADSRWKVLCRAYCATLSSRVALIWFLSIYFVCLLRLNVALTSEVISRRWLLSSGSYTNVLPHRNAMPQTQDMTPHPVTWSTCRCAIHWCGMSHLNT